VELKNRGSWRVFVPVEKTTPHAARFLLGAKPAQILTVEAKKRRQEN
jgi:hypothetical protein